MPTNRFGNERYVKTRQGEVFVRDALQNEKKVGSIEITLIQPSIGEILRTQWLAILVSFLIHGLLWLAYRAIARPSRVNIWHVSITNHA
jgi:hypothetical protein